MSVRNRLNKVEKALKARQSTTHPLVLFRVGDRICTVIGGELREAPPSWLNEQVLVIGGIDPLVALGLKPGSVSTSSRVEEAPALPPPT